MKLFDKQKHSTTKKIAIFISQRHFPINLSISKLHRTLFGTIENEKKIVIIAFSFANIMLLKITKIIELVLKIEFKPIVNTVFFFLLLVSTN